MALHLVRVRTVPYPTPASLFQREARKGARAISTTDRSSSRLADFLDFTPRGKFDVVLSVSSAHYLAEVGLGSHLFACFRSWLAPEGMLLLFAPRKMEEVPLLKVLPNFSLRQVFSFENLRSLCLEAGLIVEVLVPCIGRLGTIAKQLACLTAKVRILTPVAYPLEVCLTSFDFLHTLPEEQYSAAWIVVARNVGNCESPIGLSASEAGDDRS